MKKLFTMFILLGMLVSQSVLAASAIVNSGEYVDRLVINDPGNASGYDGLIVYFLYNENDILIEDPITHATYTENQLCWGHDTDPTPCPGDPDGNGGILSPIFYFIDSNIFATGTTTQGVPLTIAEEKMFYVAWWNELYVKKAVTIALEAMDAETGGDAFNDTQKARALKFVYFSQGIDLATAEYLADEFVYTGSIPSYVSLNLTNLPAQCQAFIYKVDEFGWLYWTERDTWSDIY